MSWRERANCQGMGPELFFADREHRPSVIPKVREAKQVCAGCDVRAACLEYALTTEAKFGIFGGCTPKERQNIRRIRRNAS